MALVSLSSKCFNAVETALEAVKSGDTKRSAVVLRSARKDGQMLKQKADILIRQLSKAEKEHKCKVENLTRQMNRLFAEETQLSNKKQTLQNKNYSLTDEKLRYQRSKEEASRKYREAERAKRDAEKEYENMKPYFWIPIVGWLLEAFEDSSRKASEAYREMQRHERDVNQAESDLRWVNSQISEVSFFSTSFMFSGKVLLLKRSIGCSFNKQEYSVELYADSLKEFLVCGTHIS